MPRKAKPPVQQEGAPKVPVRPSVAPPGPAPGPIPLTPGRSSRQPNRVPTGLPYGEATQLENAQRAAPLPGGAQPVAQPQVNPRRQMLAQAIESARAMPNDGQPFGAPSDRPNEPITAGVDVGPGPGSEVLGYNPRTRVASTLRAIASATGDADIASLAELAGSQGA